jgi:RsiW-degrading membrane proteinase PrsW (M82 family)
VSLTTTLIALGAVVVSTGLLLIVVALVWWLDRYDREPLHLVVAVFLWGALVSPTVSFTAVGAIDRFVQGSIPAESLGLIGISFFSPFVEETIKAVGVLLVVLLTDKFDNPTDGVVYGTAVGLGFAVTENFFFALGAIAESGGTGAILILVGGRTLFSAGVHALSGAAFGGFLGYAVLSSKKAARLGWLFAGLMLAFGLHSAWNMALLFVGPFSPGGTLRGWLAVLPSLYIVYVIIFAAFLYSEHRILKRELAEEVDLKLAPAWVQDVIPYYGRRVRGNWWPSRTERTVIARLLTRVAFRKHSLRRLPQDEATIASLELVKLRQRVRKILGPPENH